MFGYICSAKIKTVIFKSKISKKVIIRLLLFGAIIGAAALFDYFFDDEMTVLEEFEKGDNKTEAQNTVYLINQVNTGGIKTSVKLSSEKNPQIKSHDKLLRKYYQLRNYQVLKAEVQTQTDPIINVYHYLAFKNHFFTDPGDDPAGA